MKAAAVQNVEVYISSSDAKDGAVICTFDGARYHVNVTIPSLKVAVGGPIFSKRKAFRCLYKNPPDKTKRGSPEFFDTRYLDVAIPKNAAIVDAMMYAVNRDGLVAKALAARKAEEDAQRADFNAARVREKKEDAAEALFDACVQAEELLNEYIVNDAQALDCETASQMRETLRAALKKAGKA